MRIYPDTNILLFYYNEKIEDYNEVYYLFNKGYNIYLLPSVYDEYLNLVNPIIIKEIRIKLQKLFDLGKSGPNIKEELKQMNKIYYSHYYLSELLEEISKITNPKQILEIS